MPEVVLLAQIFANLYGEMNSFFFVFKERIRSVLMLQLCATQYRGRSLPEASRVLCTSDEERSLGAIFSQTNILSPYKITSTLALPVNCR